MFTIDGGGGGGPNGLGGGGGGPNGLVEGGGGPNGLTAGGGGGVYGGGDGEPPAMQLPGDPQTSFVQVIVAPYVDGV